MFGQDKLVGKKWAIVNTWPMPFYYFNAIIAFEEGTCKCCELSCCYLDSVTQGPPWAICLRLLISGPGKEAVTLSLFGNIFCTVTVVSLLTDLIFQNSHAESVLYREVFKIIWLIFLYLWQGLALKFDSTRGPHARGSIHRTLAWKYLQSL